MKCVALIPVRGGSKGIPRKNIKLLCGKPLLYWVCRAAQDCAAIDTVYVSTDSDEIAATARSLGLAKVQVIARAPETATDSASTESVMMDFAGRADFTHVALLQATSPLLSSDDLKRGCAKVLGGDCDSVVSVVRQKRFRWAAGADGTISPENYDPLKRPRRQDHQGFLVENGAFYITSRERLLSSGCRVSGRIEPVEMAEESYFEIDEPSDWIIAEGLLAARQRGEAISLAERIARVKLVVSDVDGCLTDSGMYYTETGDEIKKFNTRDGLGFRLLKQAGYHIGIITQENTALMKRRAAKMGVDNVHQDVTDKVPVMAGILERLGLKWEQAAYLGDDRGDLGVLHKVGLAACPNDAISEARAAAHLVLRAKGGEGAFRELAERILNQ